MPAPTHEDALSACEREPINTPGAIQAHGVLVVVQEPDMRIVEISANAQRLFGRRPAPMLGKDIRDYLGTSQYRALRKFLAHEMWSALQPITLSIPRGRRRAENKRAKWHAFCHRHDGLLFMEFEPAPPAQKTVHYYRKLRATFGKVYASNSVAALCGSAAQAVRDFTDFDRVMVYRLDADWNGEVIAEAVKDGLDGYLHHHFPCTDIPRQARAAFLNNSVRMIPDTCCKTVPLLRREGRPPLDMSKSLLRSVSPIHLQYLSNMGTRATLTISLIRDGKLWGLVACHHRSPKNLFHEARLACELIGKAVSALLTSREQMEEAVLENCLRDGRTQLWEVLERHDSVRDALWEHPDKLLAIVDAEGAAVRIDAEKPWMLVGKTPSRKQVAELAAWLSTRINDATPTFATHKLSEHYAQGKALRATACGLLAVTIPKAESNFIMWFRPERVQEKTWAGDPHKQEKRLADGSVRMEPRHSFESWKESLHLRAKPWKQIEIASALTARSDLVSVDLRQQFNLARRAILTRDDFMSMASHELKTPLTSMRLQSQMALRRLKPGPGETLQGDRLSFALQRIDGGIDRLIRLVDDMLDVSRISSGKLTILRERVGIVALAKDVVERMRGEFETKRVSLTLHCKAEAFGLWDKLRIEQCVANLLSNALRYGQASPVVVTAGLLKGSAVLMVRDAGPGIAPAAQQSIFEKFERGGQNIQGLGLGLHICKQIVELHGGSIRVKSAVGKGSRFFLSLPTQDGAAPHKAPATHGGDVPAPKKTGASTP